MRLCNVGVADNNDIIVEVHGVPDQRETNGRPTRCVIREYTRNSLPEPRKVQQNERNEMRHEAAKIGADRSHQLRCPKRLQKWYT
jgi:hypothetical protein